MSKHIVIISTAETFSVRGLEMKLKGIDMKSVYAPPEVNVLESKLGPADLIVLYTEDIIVGRTEVFEFIGNHCSEKNRKIMVIGSKGEYEVVKKLISEEFIAGFFDRPLVMDKFLNAVESFFSKVLTRRKSILIVDDNVNYMSFRDGADIMRI